MTGRDLGAIARTLAVDALAADAITALQRAGVEPVLLKGPVTAQRLYPGESRPYGDADLLVAPRRYARAEAALLAAGFARRPRDWELGGRLEHDAVWRRDDSGPAVDLHRTLPGVVGVSPQRTWRVLAPHRRRWTLPGSEVEVDVLDGAAFALLCGLHAAHHLGDEAAAHKPLADLARAVAGIDLSTWREAAALSRRLRAAEQLARGLHAAGTGRMPHRDAAGATHARPAAASTPGVALARALRLPAPAGEADVVSPRERLAAAHTAGERARLLARALAPSPAYLRWRSPLARRGLGGLLLAYLLRPLVLLRSAAR